MHFPHSFPPLAPFGCNFSLQMSAPYSRSILEGATLRGTFMIISGTPPVPPALPVFLWPLRQAELRFHSQFFSPDRRGPVNIFYITIFFLLTLPSILPLRLLPFFPLAGFFFSLFMLFYQFPDAKRPFVLSCKNFYGSFAKYGRLPFLFCRFLLLLFYFNLGAVRRRLKFACPTPARLYPALEDLLRWGEKCFRSRIDVRSMLPFSSPKVF